MPKVLITGGAGFLGTHSIEKYLAEGFDVTVIDNFTTSTVDDTNTLLFDFSEKLS